jgi:RES domain-containing protein
LPIIAIPSGTRLFRIHRLDHDAVFFSPAVDPATGERQPPTYRFDSASGNFGVLYAARQFEGAFVETILRNPQLTFVSRNYVTLRCVTELAFGRDLRLVDMHGRGLSRIGTTNAISTGPYAPCWAWSDYLYSHRGKPDGIAYASRHNPLQICYAIFERSDLSVTPNRLVRLADMLPEIRGILRSYNKILTRP